MSHSVSQIAAALRVPFAGDGALLVTGACEPAAAGPGHLALAMSPAYAQGLALGHARAAVLWHGADWQSLGLEAAIFVTRPRLALSGLTRTFDPGPGFAPGVHPMAVIDPSAVLGDGVSVGPFTSIGAGARIGSGSRIGDNVTIGAGAVLGAGALVLSGVRIGPRVIIGVDFIAQPGAVIGGDGFSFVTEQTSRVEAARTTLGNPGETAKQPWLRIHSLGSVTIGDNVEVGANTTIDRGTVRDTQIGSGTKIDNLVQVGHNVVVGEDCLLCGQVGIAGSTRIGNRVVLGGQVGVVDNIQVGDDVVAAAGTMITSNAPAGRVLMGSPAVRMDQHVAIYKAQRRLPRLMAQVAELQKILKSLVDRGQGGES